jgi:hypothetical protein
VGRADRDRSWSHRLDQRFPAAEVADGAKEEAVEEPTLDRQSKGLAAGRGDQRLDELHGLCQEL